MQNYCEWCLQVFREIDGIVIYKNKKFHKGSCLRNYKKHLKKRRVQNGKSI